MGHGCVPLPTSRPRRKRGSAGAGAVRGRAQIPLDARPSAPAFQKHESAGAAGEARAVSAGAPSEHRAGRAAVGWQSGAHGAAPRAPRGSTIGPSREQGPREGIVCPCGMGWRAGEEGTNLFFYFMFKKKKAQTCIMTS